MSEPSSPKESRVSYAFMALSWMYYFVIQAVPLLWMHDSSVAGKIVVTVVWIFWAALVCAMEYMRQPLPTWTMTSQAPIVICLGLGWGGPVMLGLCLVWIGGCYHSWAVKHHSELKFALKWMPKMQKASAQNPSRN